MNDIRQKANRLNSIIMKTIYSLTTDVMLNYFERKAIIVLSFIHSQLRPLYWVNEDIGRYWKRSIARYRIRPNHFHFRRFDLRIRSINIYFNIEFDGKLMTSFISLQLRDRYRVLK